MEQAFFDAIKAGRLDEVQSLAASHPALLRARDANGASAILFSIYNGQKDVAEALISLGAPLDLFEASALGRVERIEEILRA